jgi:hypothetical protein
MSSEPSSTTDNLWASEYISTEAPLPEFTAAAQQEPEVPFEGSSASSSSSSFSKYEHEQIAYDDTISPEEDEIDDDDDEESLVNLSHIIALDPDKQNDDNLLFTNMNYIASHALKQFRALPLPQSDIKQTTIDSIVQKLDAIMRYAKTFCIRFSQTSIQHTNQPSLPRTANGAKYGADADASSVAPNTAAKVVLTRSSYKFCDKSASCKRYPDCKAHHYVFNLLHADVHSLLHYIRENPIESWNTPEAIKSMNTISFVISHMYREYQTRSPGMLFKSVLSSSSALQRKATNGDPNWTVVETKRSRRKGGRALY